MTDEYYQIRKWLRNKALLKELEKYTTSIAHLGHVEIGVTEFRKIMYGFLQKSWVFMFQLMREIEFI